MLKLALFFLAISCLSTSYGTTETSPLKLKVHTEYRDIPAIIRSDFDGNKTIREREDFEIVFILSNDSATTDGDDQGNTHGLKVIASQMFKNGITVRAAYSSDLYTEQPFETKNEDGTKTQYFADDTITKFIIDNIESKKLFYWKAEVGWQTLTSEESSNILLASSQQRFFHDLAQNINENISTFNNISAPELESEGLITGLSLGLQKNWHMNEFTLKTRSQIGIVDSQVREADYDFFRGKLGLNYSFGTRSIELETFYEERHHIHGVESRFGQGIMLYGRKWDMGIHRVSYRGTPMNYMRYNIPNVDTGEYDSTLLLHTTYRFGGTKRTSTRASNIFNNL